MKRLLTIALLASIAAHADNCSLLPAQTNLSWNNLLPKPMMGWASWYAFSGAVSETIIKAQADALVSTGLYAAGYNYVNIDDGWAATARDGSGNIQPDATKFPSGMASLATYVHANTEKFGIYTSPGVNTCLGSAYMASGGHEAADATTFASWGVDYLKYDWCVASGLYPSCYTTKTPEIYQLMAQSLRATGRNIALSGLGPLPAGQPDPWTYYKNAGYNAARIADDLFNSMLPFGYNANNTMDVMAPISSYQTVGAYNDPDMLIGGNGIILSQARQQFSMLALWSSPLVISTDLTTIDAGLLTLYKNAEVIAINQDPLVKQATRFSKTSCGSWSCQLWFKQMSGGAWAVGMINLDAAPHSMTVTFSDVSAGTFNVRNVWAASNLGQISSYTTTVPAYDIILLKLSSTAATKFVISQ